MDEIFIDSYLSKRNERRKKMYSYTNWKWKYYHEIYNALREFTTMHEVFLPWEFLEHHTDEEIRNFFGEKTYKRLDTVTSWLETDEHYIKYKKRRTMKHGAFLFKDIRDL